MTSKGFTLLEIVVVTSIIILLTVVVFVDYRGTEKDFALTRSAHKLSQDLRQVEEMAMSSQKTPLEFGEQVFPKGGYGIHFVENSDSYILFADCNDNNNYDRTGGAISCEEATNLTPYPETIKEFFLEEGIKIKEVVPFPSPLNITFTPPDPTITISGGTQAVITLCLKDNQEITKTITVNTVGLIDTE